MTNLTSNVCFYYVNNDLIIDSARLLIWKNRVNINGMANIGEIDLFISISKRLDLLLSFKTKRISNLWKKKYRRDLFYLLTLLFEKMETFWCMLYRS